MYCGAVDLYGCSVALYLFLHPLFVLQITSEVHLFSHIKGKRHQQAVRDSSSIQGRELSDEEVVSKKKEEEEKKTGHHL